MPRFSSKYNPGGGAVALLAATVAALFFFKWALGPLWYEKSQSLELSGHKAYAAKKFTDAYAFFLKSAGYSDEPAITARRYRCAAYAAHALGKKEKALEFAAKALRYNKNNKLAKLYIIGRLQDGETRPETFTAGKYSDILPVLFVDHPIIYLNRTADGWSRGGNGGALVNAQDECTYVLKMVSYKPSAKGVRVSWSINGKPVSQTVLQSGREQTVDLPLTAGGNTITIYTKERFVPSQVNKGSIDNRTLGIKFSILIGA